MSRGEGLKWCRRSQTEWWMQDSDWFIHIVLILNKHERRCEYWNGHSFDSPTVIPEELSLEEAKALAFTTWRLRNAP